MIRFLLFVTILLGVLGLYSCAERSVDLAGYEDQVIIFGRGGGISGSYSEFILLEDGRIFQRDSATDSLGFIQRVGKKKTRAAFSDFAQLSQIEINAPGDVYYYVGQKYRDNDTQLMWGDPSIQADPDLIAFWSRLSSLTKTR